MLDNPLLVVVFRYARQVCGLLKLISGGLNEFLDSSKVYHLVYRHSCKPCSDSCGQGYADDD